MLFTSYAFFGFFALLLLLYYVVPQKQQWKILLVFNAIFYLCAGPKQLIYLLITALSTWFFALQIGKNLEAQKAYIRTHKAELSKEEKKAYKEKRVRVRKRLVTICILLNVGILAALKYTNFFISNLNGILGLFSEGAKLPFLRIALPLGISFYTLQAIGYLVDVYRGAVKAEKNFAHFALFLTFFPQLIQGPISRYDALSTSLLEPHPFQLSTLSSGLQRMLWGYFKKLVVADRLMPAVLQIVGDVDTYHGVYALVGMLFYTVQLYADFTGGIDITIGVAETLGVSVHENFNLPYFSKSLKEYWRRWHITMCEWFKDYLFYPISASRPMQKLSRFTKTKFGANVGRRLPMYLSSFIIWFTTGLWHGASWNFIVWGLLNWAILMISEELRPLYKKFHDKFPKMQGRGYDVFQMIRTFCLVCVMNIFDCYKTLGETMRSIGSVFTANNWHILTDGSLLKLGLSAADYGMVIFGILLMLAVSLWQYKQEKKGAEKSLRVRIRTLPYPARFAIWYGLFLTVLIFGAYGVGYDASQFIYNQF